MGRGATTFSKLGVQFLGLGYCTEQKADGIPSFVHCSLLRNGNHTFHQKRWGGPSIFFGGERVRTPFPLSPPVVAPLQVGRLGSGSWGQVAMALAVAQCITDPG